MPTQNELDKKEKRWVYLVFIIGGLLLFGIGSIVVLLVIFVTSFGVSSAGSPKLAAEWRNEMESWVSPEDAVQDSTLSIVEFTNGEWVIIKSKDSHGGTWSGGGTVVVKDSTGHLSAFHEGHVCGDGYPSISHDYDDLESFYEALELSDFQEFVLE